MRGRQPSCEARLRLGAITRVDAAGSIQKACAASASPARTQVGQFAIVGYSEDSGVRPGPVPAPTKESYSCAGSSPRSGEGKNPTERSDDVRPTLDGGLLP